MRDIVPEEDNQRRSHPIPATNKIQQLFVVQTAQPGGPCTNVYALGTNGRAYQFLGDDWLGLPELPQEK